MYSPLPNDNPDVIVKKTVKGRGVFAARDISVGSLIAEFVGEMYESEFETRLPARMVDHVIQVGPISYVFAEGRLAELVNHSCDPNCGIRNLTQIFAAYPIKAGEEITWDYRCSENSDWVLPECLCGAKRCTGRIGNFDSLPDDMVAQYLSKGMVSEWLT